MSRDCEKDYSMTDGERICSTAIGWNFGDGHMHNEQLIRGHAAAVPSKPGEVRVVLLDAQPITIQARPTGWSTPPPASSRRATSVADAVTRQPWDDDRPGARGVGGPEPDPVLLELSAPARR